MPIDADKAFFDRADAHIHLSNTQTTDADRGSVSASMMFATARFNAWLSASSFQSGEQMAEKRGEAINYFVSQYKMMLQENLDEYINNFERYMQPGGKKS